MSLTGDWRTDAVVPAATELVWAVREQDADTVARILTTTDLPALMVVLAAMVPDDQTPRDLLAWLASPEEYQRLRCAGVDSATAGVLAAQTREAA